MHGVYVKNNKTDNFKTAVSKYVIPLIVYHFNCLNPIINFLHVISTKRSDFFVDMELVDWSVKEKAQLSYAGLLQAQNVPVGLGS
jgi:hypothetical protein